MTDRTKGTLNLAVQIVVIAIGAMLAVIGYFCVSALDRIDTNLAKVTETQVDHAIILTSHEERLNYLEGR
ncbi:MAG: hypothetical protein AAGA45_00020 [Verrucomicrobiota bacterium]